MTNAQVQERLKLIEAELKALRGVILNLVAQERLLAAVKVLRADCVRRNGTEP